MLQSNSTEQWSPEATTTHQDHVIAHVLGASVLAYFVHDESLHLLLDIGFVWTIYLDGQMVLLPQSVALRELDADPELRAHLNREIEELGRAGSATHAFQKITAAPVECLITEVGFFADGDRRRFVLSGEDASLLVETSLTTAEIEVIAA